MTAKCYITDASTYLNKTFRLIVKPSFCTHTFIYKTHLRNHDEADTCNALTFPWAKKDMSQIFQSLNDMSIRLLTFSCARHKRQLQASNKNSGGDERTMSCPLVDINYTPE